MAKTSSVNVATVPVGPGKILLDARIQQRLSREQVAEILHLSPQQIIALENDDFENLPGPTYVRGYLRNYAQALGLPAEDVMAAYARLNGTQGCITLSRLAPEPEVTTKDGSVKFATFLVAGILILLAIVWWQGRHYVPASSASAGEPEMTEGATATSVAVYVGEQTTSAGPGEPEQRWDEIRLITPQADLNRPRLGASPTGVAGDQAASAYETSPGSAVNIDDELLGPKIAGQEVGAAGTELTLHAREASWVDIRDARQNKLLYGVLPAGRTVTLVGMPPFRVFLGNPDGVELEYKGEYFVAGQYKRRIVARFTVGMPVMDTAR